MFTGENAAQEMLHSFTDLNSISAFVRGSGPGTPTAGRSGLSSRPLVLGSKS